MTTWALLAVVHAAATVMMTGLIWFVQIVHYPLMAHVGADRFVVYERLHQKRTTVVVGPLMLVEAVTAVALLALAPDRGAGRLLAVGLGLLAIIWCSTAFIQVPCHRRLERGLGGETVALLTRTNWIRTGAWSGRAAIALALLA